MISQTDFAKIEEERRQARMEEHDKIRARATSAENNGQDIVWSVTIEDYLEELKPTILDAIRNHDDWDEKRDPEQDHGAGVVEVAGHLFCWRVREDVSWGIQEIRYREPSIRRALFVFHSGDV